MKKTKNCWVIPTDKPSRLCINCRNQMHIYITSDEEIKDCWVLNTHTNEVYFLKGYYGIQPIAKKIILTTDQDLDGVQAIDDEFLEWFVQNQSCESIEVDIFDVDYGNYNKNSYEIIIPKEEPKQILCGYPDKHYNCKTCGEPCGLDGHFIDIKEEPKQETLEELAEKYSINEFPLKDFEGTQWNNQRENCKGDFLAGAKAGVKWQQEQDKNKYSALETAILLLKQTIEYEVLDSWKQKVKELEQLINKI
jgi:hypothetical protein